MDSITHTVLGACLGEVIAGKKMGKRAMLIGALANNFPDVDVVTKFWTTPAGALLAHRGFTHSIISCLIFTWLFAYVFNRRNRYPEMNFKSWLLLFGCNIFTHIFIDAFTSYGTGWFEPFSNYRVSFNTMFILDPAFMLPVLAGTVVLLVLKRNSASRPVVVRIALGLSCMYAVYTWVNKVHVNNIVKENIKAQHVSGDDYMVAPTALNNFLWYIAVKGSVYNYVGYYSIFDKCNYISFYRVQKNDSLLGPYDENETEKLRRFSNGYYCVTRNADTTIFNDMRFGQIGGWSADVPFVFRFDMSKDANNATRLQQGRMNAAGKEEIKKLWARVKGI